MSQPVDILSTDPEGTIAKAILAINQGKIKSVWAVAEAYFVPYKTLDRRLNGVPLWRNSTPNSQKLTDLEESVIVQHILDLDLQGFSPRLHAVEDMANQLFANWGGGKVGKNWASNFVKHCLELKIRFNCKYNYKQAQCKDPELIRQWFKLVQNTIAKHVIAKTDIYNFDKTGF